mgnify:CR=1 FL=1
MKKQPALPVGSLPIVYDVQALCVPDISKPARAADLRPECRSAIAVQLYPFAGNIFLSYRVTVRGDVLLHTQREVEHYNQP